MSARDYASITDRVDALAERAVDRARVFQTLLVLAVRVEAAE